MHVYIVFTHPSRESFSQAVLEAFTCGLADGGHTFEVGDLYDMGFESEMTEAQYFRELGLDPHAPVPDDVQAEQDKIDRADALVFVYPLWWSDCPAKLKGWFDRVLTYGYAYFYDAEEQRHSRMTVEKALVLCSAGHTVEHLDETGVTQSMHCIMLDDRLLGVGVKAAEMEILGGMMPGDDSNWQGNLQRAYELGKAF